MIFDMRTAPERLGAATVVASLGPRAAATAFANRRRDPGVVVNANDVAQGTLTWRWRTPRGCLAASSFVALLSRRRRPLDARASAPVHVGRVRRGHVASLLPKTTAVTHLLSIR